MGLFSRVGTSEDGARSAVDRLSHELQGEHHARHALSDSKRHLRRKLVLWSAFLAVHANPVPGFPLVVMAYVIGALGGSLPLPAAIGTVGGVAGMLVLYGVDHNPAVAAVLLHQAIGILVPLTGGAIAYTLLRRRLGPLRASTAEGPADLTRD